MSEGGCKVSETKQKVREAVAANEKEEVKRGALPITVLSGFLGAGKTTLLRHLLEHAKGRKIACIVNDVAALNIDSALIKNLGERSDAVKEQSEELVELQNGCVCCTLRADLVKSVAELAKQGHFDHVVIECTGMAEPVQVASSFLMALAISENERSTLNEDQLQSPMFAGLPSLDRLARLDTLVTVIDTGSFLDVLKKTGNIFVTDDGTGEGAPVASVTPSSSSSSSSAPSEGPKLLVDLMIGQVEFANVILLNKTDLVSPATLEKVKKSVAALNPGAQLYTTSHSVIDPELILHTQLFEPEKTVQGVGWLRALRETKEYGVGSFVYRRRRPFHPGRLVALLKDNFYVDDDWESRIHHHNHDEEGHDHDHDHHHPHDDPETREKMEKEMKEAAERKENGVFRRVLRSKGYLWLATRPCLKGSWGQAGGVVRIDPDGLWAVSFFPPLPEGEEESEDRKKLREEIESNEFGDRKQEVVIIGEGLGEEGGEGGQKDISDALDSCLVTDEEWSDLAKIVLSDPLSMWQQEPFDNWDKYIPEEERENWYQKTQNKK